MHATGVASNGRARSLLPPEFLPWQVALAAALVPTEVPRERRSEDAEVVISDEYWVHEDVYTFSARSSYNLSSYAGRSRFSLGSRSSL